LDILVCKGLQTLLAFSAVFAREPLDLPDCFLVYVFCFVLPEARFARICGNIIASSTLPSKALDVGLSVRVGLVLGSLQALKGKSGLGPHSAQDGTH
jgi:hypothetical protein